MVAMRKQPNVSISAGLESSEIARFSQAAKTAIGIGVASDLSKGVRVFDFKKSDTVWLCKAEMIGKSNFNANQRSALICVVIRVLDGSEVSFLPVIGSMKVVEYQ